MFLFNVVLIIFKVFSDKIHKRWDYALDHSWRNDSACIRNFFLHALWCNEILIVAIPAFYEKVIYLCLWKKKNWFFLVSRFLNQNLSSTYLRKTTVKINFYFLFLKLHMIIVTPICSTFRCTRFCKPFVKKIFFPKLLRVIFTCLQN